MCRLLNKQLNFIPATAGYFEIAEAFEAFYRHECTTGDPKKFNI